METLEFIKTAKDGRIIIDVPENLEGKEVKVQVTEIAGEEAGNTSKLSANEKINDLMKYYGTAKFPDIDLDKHNVYEQ